MGLLTRPWTGDASLSWLVLAGARLYLACRNPQAGEATALKLRTKTNNQAIHFLHLDLTDFDSVQAFVESFLKCELQHFFLSLCGICMIFSYDVRINFTLCRRLKFYAIMEI